MIGAVVGAIFGFIAPLVCLTISYSIALSLLVNANIGAVTTGLFFALVLSIPFAMIRAAGASPPTAFITTNVILAAFGTLLHFSSAKRGSFSFYDAAGASWVNGQPHYACRVQLG